VKLSYKLNILQEAAKLHQNEPNKLYLIALLAEHAEEEEMTAELLAWVNALLL